MEGQQVHITLTPSENNFSKEYGHSIRFGKAADLPQIQKQSTNTNFDGLVAYMKHRCPPKDTSIIECNPDKLEITLYEDKSWETSPIVYAKEIINPELAKLGINEPTKFNRKELIELVKKNRCYIEQGAPDKLIAALSNLAAKVEANIDQGENNKGQKHNNFSQNITLNHTAEVFKFALNVSVILGAEKTNLVIDICYDTSANGLIFWLECPELASIIDNQKNTMIDSVSAAIKALEYLVIYTNK